MFALAIGVDVETLAAAIAGQDADTSETPPDNECEEPPIAAGGILPGWEGDCGVIGVDVETLPAAIADETGDACC